MCDEFSLLIDGVTAIQDVQRALDIDDLPHVDEYETLAGFLMIMLRRIPRRTDQVVWEGWRFEVVDVDSHRVDQVMIARDSLNEWPTAEKPLNLGGIDLFQIVERGSRARFHAHPAK